MATNRCVTLCAYAISLIGCGGEPGFGVAGPGSGAGIQTDNVSSPEAGAAPNTETSSTSGIPTDSVSDTETGDISGTETALEEPPYVQPAPWSEMTHPQRFDFMRNVVVVEMREVFQEFDPERYAKFGCTSCHGENAAEVGFAMPNDLAPLHVADFPLTRSEDPRVAATATFMQEVVAPTMAGLLENEQGFGCFNCHGFEEG